ncbi:endopeptidase La [Synergistaceae bacterium OttesenSCG-928-D05]|nr:endopeptidase La [Synergistaceae bacterium OttesenSCG-928-D05]
MSLHPVLPVRDMVIFPGVIAPVFISRPRSVKAIEEATANGELIFIVAQKHPSTDSPGPNDLYSAGTLCKVLRSIRLPDGTTKAMIEGGWRCRVSVYMENEEYLEADVEKIKIVNAEATKELEALRRSVLSEFETYAKLNPKMPDSMSLTALDTENPATMADIICSHSHLKIADKQVILETEDVVERLNTLLRLLVHENEYLVLEHQIQEKVRGEIDKGQRNYYLREQLKIIQDELDDGGGATEIEELHKRVDRCGMPTETAERAHHEITRYSKMAPISPEATVSKNYIEWLIDLPWSVSSEDHIDLKQAKKILNEDHYGLQEVKERILEFLAVRKLAANDMRAQVLCFVGPPGVGKTSLGKSIARTMGRKFVSMSLGGMRDEAEIRGHRRTYVGALPGRVIQKIKQAGTNNPVLLMDEIDKIGSDFRGDPAAALLEVLDPEQNCSFTDNFIELSFDLSKVMFITTANSVATIPRPLLDRMEMIYLPGYVAEEKIKIAKKHLLPRIYKEHGLTVKDISIPDAAIKKVIAAYTMEAGVRGLDRQLSKISRKVAAEIAENNGNCGEKPKIISLDTVQTMLGAPKLHVTHIPRQDALGAAIGLAWTETGGAVLVIESAVMEGGGHVSYTGNLGDIMQESAQTALAYLRSRAETYNLTNFDWQKKDIHIHVPEGAVPKDGPSAGITLALSLCSALTGRKIDNSYAMTGEMTLHGEVLPIGGVREKILAAKRMGIKKLIMPDDNRAEIQELSEWILSGVTIHYAKTIDKVFELTLRPADVL